MSTHLEMPKGGNSNKKYPKFTPQFSSYLDPCKQDVCPTGDQEVADSNPAGSANVFRGDLILKYFLWSL